MPVPNIPRGVEKFGQGATLTYAVFGDSTTVGQGADYDSGYVRATARYLADKGYTVQLQNFGVSGARAADVPARQIPHFKEQQLRPDIALIAVTANDVTHLTGINSIEKSLVQSIEQLRAVNASVQIIVTGSPQMGTVPRFPQPAQSLARFRSDQVNAMVKRLTSEQRVIFAPIAKETGPIFKAHPEFYASDLFHPNAQGYATWTPVIAKALDSALSSR